MMNKSYKIKKLCLQILIFCSFVQVYFLKFFYSNLIFNIADLILLGKNATQKNKRLTNLPTLSAIQKYANHFPFRLHCSS